MAANEVAFVLPPIFGQALNTVEHKFGGKVLRITGIGHETVKALHGRSQDVWFFIGDVDWRGGSSSRDIEISPAHLCNPGQELDALCNALSEYLLAFGEWHHDRSKNGWFALDRGEPKKRVVSRSQDA